MELADLYKDQLARGEKKGDAISARIMALPRCSTRWLLDVPAWIELCGEAGCNWPLSGVAVSARPRYCCSIFRGIADRALSNWCRCSS